MDFTTRFDSLKESYDVTSNSAITAKIDEAIAVAEPLTKRINTLNADYEKAMADEDTATADTLKEEAVALNSQLHKAYKLVQDEFLHLDQEMSIIFPHDNKESNIENLNASIASLEKGDGQEALDEYLWAIGTGWNALAFDKEVVDFFGKNMKEGIKGTWAEGRVDVPDCYADDVIRSVMAKVESGNNNFDAEVAELKALADEQQKQLDSIISGEMEGLDAIIKNLSQIK
jgi:hypothetical protein